MKVEGPDSPPPPLRPLKQLPAAPDGRQVLLQVGRPAAMLTFASLNLDGPPPSLPPTPPPPPPPSPARPTFPILKVLQPRRLNPDAVEFDKLPFSARIALLSVRGVGVERYRWQHKPLWPLAFIFTMVVFPGKKCYALGSLQNLLVSAKLSYALSMGNKS